MRIARCVVFVTYQMLLQSVGNLDYLLSFLIPGNGVTQDCDNFIYKFSSRLSDEGRSTFS